MTKTFQIFIQYLWGSSRLEFWILAIRICFGFRASCFEFMENRISKQFSLNQQVVSLNDVALPFKLAWCALTLLRRFLEFPLMKPLQER